MNFISRWLANAFPERRITPDEADLARQQKLFIDVFTSPSGRELLELWIEKTMFSNPQTTDPLQCVAFTARCAFIEDIVKALDKVQNPSKYAQAQTQLGEFDPRKRRVA